jgi:hypothetical protein
MGGVERGTYPLRGGEESAIHIIFKFPETQSWRVKYTERKWLMIKEERALRKLRVAPELPIWEV